MIRIQYTDGGTIYERFNTKKMFLKAVRTVCHHLEHLLTWFMKPCQWVIVWAQLLSPAIRILDIAHPRSYAETLRSDSVNPPPPCTFPLPCSHELLMPSTYYFLPHYLSAWPWEGPSSTHPVRQWQGLPRVSEEEEGGRRQRDSRWKHKQIMNDDCFFVTKYCRTESCKATGLWI